MKQFALNRSAVATRTPEGFRIWVQRGHAPGKKAKPVSWLYCDVDEFLRLLALHEAGEINLLEMDGAEIDEPDEDSNDE